MCPPHLLITVCCCGGKWVSGCSIQTIIEYMLTHESYVYKLEELRLKPSNLYCKGRFLTDFLKVVHMKNNQKRIMLCHFKGKFFSCFQLLHFSFLRMLWCFLMWTPLYWAGVSRSHFHVNSNPEIITTEPVSELLDQIHKATVMTSFLTCDYLIWAHETWPTWCESIGLFWGRSLFSFIQITVCLKSFSPISVRKQQAVEHDWWKTEKMNGNLSAESSQFHSSLYSEICCEFHLS